MFFGSTSVPGAGNWSRTEPSPYVFSSTGTTFMVQPAAWKHSLTEPTYLNVKSGTLILSGSL